MAEFSFEGLPLIICTECGHYATVLPRELSEPCTRMATKRQKQDVKLVMEEHRHPTKLLPLQRLPMLSERVKNFFRGGAGQQVRE